MPLAFAGVLFVLGVGGAFVSGLVGVGGAIVMIPFLLYGPPLLGVGALDIKTVAAITMVQVFVASVSGMIAHGRHRAVNRRLATVGGAAMAAGSLAGAVGSKYVPERWLLVVFATMVTVAFALMLLPEPPPDVAQPAEVKEYSAPLTALTTGVVGVAAGLVGAGGAFLLVPVLVGVLRVPMRLSIGTSLAMVGMAAVSGFVGKVATGQVPLWPAATVVLGSLGGAPLGGRVSRRVPVGVLRGVLAGIIALVTARVWLDVVAH